MARRPGPERRHSRTGLFLPYILLAAVVVLWSAGWFYVRSRAASEMDAWLAREAAAGRAWTCADRAITGFPFRIELRCASLAFARADGRFTLGPLTAVVQVYQPRQGILQVVGPFHVEQGDLVGDATWRSLGLSFHGASDGFVRASLAVDDLSVGVRGAEPDPIAVTAGHLEIHARPTPGRFESEGAIDASLRLGQARAPLIDPILGNADPADVALDATVERATSLRTGEVAAELEAWREAGGGVAVTLLSIVKGDRRLQAQGHLGLDEAHRPAGQLDLRAAGLEGLIAQAMGQRFGAEKGALIGNLVGQFLGGAAKRAGQEAKGATPGDVALKPLPQLRLGDGRVQLGPIPIPSVRLPALY